VRVTDVLKKTMSPLTEQFHDEPVNLMDDPYTCMEFQGPST
jgi:hypothetical protein